MLAMQVMNYMVYPKFYQPGYFLELMNVSLENVPVLEDMFNLTDLMLEVRKMTTKIQFLHY